MDNDISEAKAMELNSDMGAEEYFREWQEDQYVSERQAALSRLRRNMEDAKRAQVGSTIRCAQCERRMVKTSYQKRFCSNARTHGKKNCKDLWHNRVAGLSAYIVRKCGGNDDG